MGCMERGGDSGACACGYRDGSPTDSPLHLEPRTVLLDQYLLGRVLGHGGFGITYLAWDLNLETKLAVKEYLPTGVATRTAGQTTVAPFSGQSKQDYEWGLEKFLEEARVLARFKQHPGIVSVVNFFRANGTAYLAMEYVEGVTLAHYLDQAGGKIPWERTLRLMLPVMDALREVHRAGVLHRDISPDNVYLTGSGGVKVLDFGAARYALGQQSRNLSVILKESYAPEEQYRTKGNQGPWTDVYGAAATMYRAITGQAPTPALDRLNQDDLPKPSFLGAAIAPDSEAILMKGLAVRASERYQSMEDFAQALTASGRTRKLTRPLASDPEIERPTPPKAAPVPAAAGGAPAGQLRGWWQRTPKQISIGGGAVLLLLLIWALKPSGGGGPSGSADGVAPPSADRGGGSPKESAKKDGGAGAGRASIGGDESARRGSPPPRNDSRSAGGGSASRQAAALEIRSFVVEPAQARPGERVRIGWSVRGAREVVIQPGIGAVTPVDNQVWIDARGTQTFTLFAEGADGTSAQRTATLTVTGAKLEPRIVSFEASPQRVKPGEQVRLSWNVADARIVDINPRIGTVELSGERTIAPVRTTYYTLIARPDSGPSVQKSVRVDVVFDGSAPHTTPEAPRSAIEERATAGGGRPAAAQAGELMAATVFHDHEGLAGLATGGLGKLGVRRDKRSDYCQGRLVLRHDRILFQGNHRFDQPLSAIAEVKTNRLPVQGRPAFHIKFKNGDNYNFGAVSDDASQIASTLEDFRRAMVR
jgi:serine/threonine protein kinase